MYVRTCAPSKLLYELCPLFVTLLLPAIDVHQSYVHSCSYTIYRLTDRTSRSITAAESHLPGPNPGPKQHGQADQNRALHTLVQSYLVRGYYTSIRKTHMMCNRYVQHGSNYSTTNVPRQPCALIDHTCMITHGCH